MILALFFTVAAVVTLSFYLLRNAKFTVCQAAEQKKDASQTSTPENNSFQSRVKPLKKNENSISQSFIVEISGDISIFGKGSVLQISITDITEPDSQPKTVHSAVEQWRKPNSPAFLYSTETNGLFEQGKSTSVWVPVAEINTDWLSFPRKGKRSLQFITSIHQGQNNKDIQQSIYDLVYENKKTGYIDIRENTESVKLAAVPIAFAVSAAGKNVSNREVAVIKNWVKNTIRLFEEPYKTRRKLKKQLKQAVCFSRDGNSVNVQKLCSKILPIASLAERYDILELCLQIARTNDSVTVEQINLLNQLAEWLKVKKERFREMREKILPAYLYEVEDVEAVLGIDSTMNEDAAREHLNQEYRKWNARVTSSDSQVQTHAAYMLTLIGQARTKFAEDRSN